MAKQRTALRAVMLVAIGLNAPVFANTSSVDVAKGAQFSNGGVLLIKYKPTKFEYHVDMWDGDNDNTAIGIGYPLEWQGKLRLGWTPGLAVVSKETDSFGTHWQFYRHFRLQYSGSERLKFDLGWIHYSNGSRVFNYGYIPNRGGNFVTLVFNYSY